jgi:glycosyltransferase involved in cell wall biosynthesis
MEQHIGHRTYAKNLRLAVKASALQSHWVDVTYFQAGGFYERLNFLPANVRGTLRGRAQTRAGLNRAYDVAFFNTQVPAALAGGMVFRKPYILSTDITPIQYDAMGARYNHRTDRFAPLRWYKHRVNVKLFRDAARLVPWSHWVNQSLIDDYGVDAARIEVIPPGVDLATWFPKPRTLENKPTRVLFVGGDLYRKGGATLLQAFEYFSRAEMELWMVTRSPAPQMEGVRGIHNLQANDPRLIEIYQACDFFVLPTDAEAFGIAAVEASAVSLPIIVSALGGLVDVVEDGVTGFAIQPGDVRALVESMRALMNDPARRARMGNAARARVEAKFDAHKNSARIVELLTQVASEKK